MASQQQASVASILRTHPPQKWDTSDVKRWLESIGMDVYAPIFEATGVQGADLIHMDAEALKRRCGVSSLGHRTQIMSQIAVLSARANMSIKREGERSAVSKRKEVGVHRRDGRRRGGRGGISSLVLLEYCHFVHNFGMNLSPSLPPLHSPHPPSLPTSLSRRGGNGPPPLWSLFEQFSRPAEISTNPR